jgi:hypothetical protein
MKALFASAFAFAASCFASSVTSCSLSVLNSGEGGTLVGGVELMGVELADEDAVLMVVLVRNELLTGYYWYTINGESNLQNSVCEKITGTRNMVGMSKNKV